MDTTLSSTDAFEHHRSLLFGISYRILGRAMDAEDVVQDAWLRWSEVDHSEVAEPKAYLARIVNRLSIDRLRRAQTRKETYVGEWLPEPILTTPDIAEDVALADTVSLGLLVVLEALSPLERAVFVLREAFDFSYSEIAQMLDRGEPAIRQLNKRARDHVQQNRPRFDADQTTRREVTKKFLQAASTGDVEGLLKLLAPDVVLHSDGGGVQKAPIRIILGSDKVGRFLAAIGQQPPPDPTMYLAPINGQLAVLIVSEEKVHTVISLDVGDGQITAIHLLTNPLKFRALGDAVSLGTPLGSPWD